MDDVCSACIQLRTERQDEKKRGLDRADRKINSIGRGQLENDIAERKRGMERQRHQEASNICGMK